MSQCLLLCTSQCELSTPLSGNTCDSDSFLIFHPGDGNGVQIQGKL